MRSPTPLHGEALHDYFLGHVKHKKASFYRVTRPLFAFKKALVPDTAATRFRCEAIVNLIIPRGALVYAPRASFFQNPAKSWQFKLRASEAYVHSIHTNYKGQQEVAKAQSKFSPSFEYVPGKTVKPDNGFYEQDRVCAPGVHFFLNLRHARAYDL